jgi:hypothetical protein
MLIRFSPHGDMPPRTSLLGRLADPAINLPRGMKTVAVVATIQSEIWKPKLNSFDQNSVIGTIYGLRMVKE